MTDVEREERAIYAFAIATLLPVVVVAIARHVTFEGGTTLSLLIVVLAAVGLLASLARRWRGGPPLARAHPRKVRP